MNKLVLIKRLANNLGQVGDDPYLRGYLIGNIIATLRDIDEESISLYDGIDDYKQLAIKVVIKMLHRLSWRIRDINTPVESALLGITVELVDELISLL